MIYWYTGSATWHIFFPTSTTVSRLIVLKFIGNDDADDDDNVEDDDGDYDDDNVEDDDDNGEDDEDGDNGEDDDGDDDNHYDDGDNGEDDDGDDDDENDDDDDDIGEDDEDTCMAQHWQRLQELLPSHKWLPWNGDHDEDVEGGRRQKYTNTNETTSFEKKTNTQIPEPGWWRVCPLQASPRKYSQRQGLQQPVLIEIQLNSKKQMQKYNSKYKSTIFWAGVYACGVTRALQQKALLN